MQPSFGNVMCSACITRPICLITSSSAAVGQCVCTLRQTSYQTCSQISERVVPDPTQLCLVSLTSSAFSASSSVYSANMASLAACQCALLNQAQSYCLSVYNGNVDTLLTVGLSMLRRRSLLSIVRDDPPLIASLVLSNQTDEWYGADEPCRSLMLALYLNQKTGSVFTQQMSITDMYMQSECQRMRDIGERAIIHFNLSALKPVAFTSLTLLLETAASDPEATQQLARHLPQLTAFLLTYQSWFQPLTVLGLRALHIIPLSATNLFQQNNFTSLLMSSIEDEFTQTNINNTTKPNINKRMLPDLVVLLHQQQRHYTKPNQHRPQPPPLLHHSGNRYEYEYNNLYNQTPRRGKRALLQSVLDLSSFSDESWKKTLSTIKQETVNILTGSISQQMTAQWTSDPAAQWSQGPFVWPPDYSQLNAQSSQCLMASIAFNYTLFTLTSTVAYYTGNAPPRPVVERTFLGCIPKLPKSLFVGPDGEPMSASDASNTSPATYGPTYKFAFFDDLTSSVLGLDRSYIMGYISQKQPGNQPSQLSQDISTVFTCDFNSVQHCTRFTRDLGWGALVLALAFGIFSYIARSISISYADPMLFLSYMPLLAVFVFGVSPFCSPMISTCLMDEVTHLTEYLLPVSISWPNLLQYYPGCAEKADPPASLALTDTWRRGTAACFKPCTDWPFGFQDPRDNVVWISLRLNLPEFPSYLSGLSTWSGTLWSPLAYLFSPIASLIPDNVEFMGARYDTKRPYLDWPDMRDAQDVCCALTSFNLALLAFGFVGLNILLLAACVIPVLLAQFAVALVLAVLVGVHT